MKVYQTDKPVVLIGQPSGNYSFFAELMAQLFGKKFLDLSDRQGAQIPQWPSTPDRPDGRWIPEIDCVGGIFDGAMGNDVDRCCPDDSQFILLVADPFAAAVRGYRQSQIESDQGRFWMRGQLTHVDQHFRCVDEYLDRYPQELYDHLPKHLTLENYEDVFAERYIYVGLAENPKDSARKIADAVGGSPESMPALPIVDASNPLPEHLRGRFERNFPLLNRIFDFATQSSTT